MVRHATFFSMLRRAEIAEALLAATRERLEAMTQDFRACESERRALVDKVGLAVTQGAPNHYLFNTDPFAEQASKPDEYLSPPPDDIEAPNMRAIEQALDEPRPTTGDGTI